MLQLKEKQQRNSSAAELELGDALSSCRGFWCRGAGWEEEEEDGVDPQG